MESILAANNGKIQFVQGEPVNEEGFIICACGCGKPTTIKAGTPIDLRPFDVEGAGTLREECWNRIYGANR
jgi:hypothetical protein